MYEIAQTQTHAIVNATLVVVAWCIVGSALSAINDVNQHRARLLLGRVTVCGQVNRLGM